MALKGNQKKLDKNNNNRIDAQDFKILKAEKAKGRGMGLQDEKVKPGKVMKAKRGQIMKKDPTEPISSVKPKVKHPFEKKGADKFTKLKTLGRVVGRLGPAAAALGLAGAGAAKLGQTIGRKMSEKKNKKMGGGMMKRPMGYTKGGGADTGTMGEAKSKLATGIDAFKRRLKKEKLQAPKRGPMNPAKAMGGGMMMKPMGYKSGKSVKVKCKLGRNKPTKMY